MGAPASDNFPGYCFIYQRDSNGQRGLLGVPIQGQFSPTVSKLGRSVPLSAEGRGVAVRARSMCPTEVAHGRTRTIAHTAMLSVFMNMKIFGNRSGTQMGMSIRGVSANKNTRRYVDLDPSGARWPFPTRTSTLTNFPTRKRTSLWFTTGSKSGLVISLYDDGRQWSWMIAGVMREEVAEARLTFTTT